MNAKEIETIPLTELFEESRRVREKRFGNRIECCAIINAKSGRCAMDCRFCAQSVKHHTQTAAYPMMETPKLLEETAKRKSYGAHRIGWVGSGCSATRQEVQQIAEADPAVLRNDVCLSMGQLDGDSLKLLRDSGVKRYHHNLETSERFYPEICTSQKWSDRRATVERAKDAGFELCSGALFGLGETWSDRVALAETLRELQVESVPMNFLHAIPGTVFENLPPLSAEEALRIIALYRILLPETTIRICGGRPKILGKWQNAIFHAGANALMIGDYLTTFGQTPAEDIEMIARLGLVCASVWDARLNVR